VLNRVLRKAQVLASAWGCGGIRPGFGLLVFKTPNLGM
jgi:hypothetical protein